MTLQELLRRMADESPSPVQKYGISHTEEGVAVGIFANADGVVEVRVKDGVAGYRDPTAKNRDGGWKNENPLVAAAPAS